jgi:hypothetical protein
MKIGFCGPFCDTNFGDYSMLINDIFEIKVRDVVLFLPEESIRNICKIVNFYLKDYSIEICGVNVISNLPQAEIGKQYSIKYSTYCDTPVEVLNTIKNKNEIIDKLSSVDLLIVSGGGFLNEVWYAEHRKSRLYAIASVMLLATAIGKKITILGNTIGPFGGSKGFYQMLFSKIKQATISIRDDILSPVEMRSIGIYNKTQQIIDDLYFINQDLVHCNNTSKKKLSKMLNGYSDYILIEQYLPIGEIEKTIDEYIIFADQMKKKYNIRVIFCAFDNAFGGMNQGTLIKKGAKNIELWNNKSDVFLPIDDIIMLIKGAKFVLCQRYHMTVLSLANNIPFIQVLKDVCGDKRYYYTKTMGTIEKVLNKLSFDETIFFEFEYLNAMKRVSEEFDKLCSIQRTLFGEKKKENEIFEYSNRTSFIKNQILSHLK